jgi:hypothetical protein
LEWSPNDQHRRITSLDRYVILLLLMLASAILVLLSGAPFCLDSRQSISVTIWNKIWIMKWQWKMRNKVQMPKHFTYLKGRDNKNFGENNRKRFDYFWPTIYQNQVCDWRGLNKRNYSTAAELQYVECKQSSWNAKFTAPVPGTYFFSFTGHAQFPVSSSILSLGVGLYLNGNYIGWGFVKEYNSQTNQETSLTLQSTLSLRKGDEIWLQIKFISTGANLYDNPNDNWTHFTGYILEEEIIF